MKSFSVLVAGFAALAQAVQLTNSDYTVTAGKPFEITWSDASGPVTLTLKNGASTDLKTVQTITSGQTGTSFTWTPSSSLPSDTYAIEITDSSGVPNYSGQFTFAGSASASASGSASASATGSASASASASASSTAVSTVVSSTITSASSSASASASVSAAANSTIASTTVSTSTRQTSTRTSATSGSTTAPTTVPGGDAGRLGSPIALIGLTIAAMLYFQ